MTPELTFVQTLILAIVGGSGLYLIINKVIDGVTQYNLKKCELKRNQDERQLARDTVLTYLAGNLLMLTMKECLRQKYMDESTKRFCDILHAAYKKLDGNGTVDATWEQCLVLPIEPPTESKEK